MVPPTAAVAGLGYMSYLAFCPEARKSVKVVRVNKSIRLEDAKVADFIDIEDISDKAAFCRCWNSKNVSGHFAIRKKRILCYYDLLLKKQKFWSENHFLYHLDFKFNFHLIFCL